VALSLRSGGISARIADVNNKLALKQTATPNRTRTAAAANPQASPTRAGLVPGNAPLVASALTPAREVLTTGLVEPREPNMSLLGRIGGAIKGAVGGFVTGGPAGALGGAALGAISSGGARRPTVGSQVMRGVGTASMALVPQGCPPGSSGIPPFCIDLVPGGGGSGSGILVGQGEPRRTPAMIGASAVTPFIKNVQVHRCSRGSVLGIDGLCYDKRTLRKDQRKWVPPRKPLMTGGDLNAIAKAARAANRMKGAQRRLERLGLLKRPKPARGGSRGFITKAEAARALRS